MNFVFTERKNKDFTLKQIEDTNKKSKTDIIKKFNLSKKTYSLNVSPFGNMLAIAEQNKVTLYC